MTLKDVFSVFTGAHTMNNTNDWQPKQLLEQKPFTLLGSNNTLGLFSLQGGSQGVFPAGLHASKGTCDGGYAFQRKKSLFGTGGSLRRPPLHVLPETCSQAPGSPSGKNTELCARENTQEGKKIVCTSCHREIFTLQRNPAEESCDEKVKDENEKWHCEGLYHLAY